MKEFLRRIKADFLLSSVLCILLGVVFIIWNNGVLNVIGSVLAIGMIVIGVVYLGSFFLSIVTNGLSVVMGILVLAVGIYVRRPPFAPNEVPAPVCAAALTEKSVSRPVGS